MVRAYLQIESDAIIDYHCLKSKKHVAKKVKDNINNVTLDVPIITTHDTRTDITSSDDLAHSPIAPLPQKNGTLTDILKQYPTLSQKFCNSCTQSFELWLADHVPISQPSGQSENTTSTPIVIMIPQTQAPSSHPSGQSERTAPTPPMITIPQELAPSYQPSEQSERTTNTLPPISICQEQATLAQPSGQSERTTPTPPVMTIPREPEIVERSKLYTEISESKLAVLIKRAEKSNKIIRKLNDKNFTCPPLSRRLYGLAMMNSPKCGLKTAEVFIPLVITDFLAEFLPFHNLDSVPYISPSKATLKEIMIDKACNTILIERNKMKGVPLSLMCDKGEGPSRRDGASFIKLVPRYCEDEGRVIVRSIEIDTARNT